LCDSGRGFIGPLLSDSGYHVAFIDIQDSVIDALNKEDEYEVHILDQDQHVETIDDFNGIKTTDPATTGAIARADLVTTSVGPQILKKVAPVLAEGIKQRRKENSKDLTVIACENMVGATSDLKEHVFECLKSTSGEDQKYAEEHVGWANCEVDRIVPPFKGHHPLEVGVEGFYEWVVEKGQIKGDLAVKGMQVKDNLAPFLDRKLYTLNCGHAILSFLGGVKGYSTIDLAFADQEVRDITRKALGESGAALCKKHGFDSKEHEAYIERTMERYGNPNIHDELIRVSRNPLRKLSPKERLTGAVNMCSEYGLPKDNLLKGIAAVFYFDEPDDEEAIELQKLVKEKGIKEAVEETTGFKRGSDEHAAVVKDYEALGKWRK
jgi:mannitol-1-phosphate 5-dehydrogenase